jgi:D-alanine-D-alanine ligase
MSANKYEIVLLFNDDTHGKSSNPLDDVAVQSTVATTNSLYKALLSLGYSTRRIAVRDSLEVLSSTLGGLSRENTLIFNNCDGFDGSNQAAAEIVRLIEELGFKHTGASTEAVELCIDKGRAKQRLRAHHVPTPHCQVFKRAGQSINLAFPVIVKPSVEDGSIGITLDSVVTTPKQLRQQVRSVLKTYAEPALVEEFIAGRELAVAMLGNDPIEVLPIAEDDYSQIENPLERLLTYDSKWDPESPNYERIPSRVPADLTPEDLAVVEKAACDSFHAVGLRDFGRVDIRFDQGIPYVIDINELPDLALDAGFWKSAQATGMTYPQMVDKIVKHALQREGMIP